MTTHSVLCRVTCATPEHHMQRNGEIYCEMSTTWQRKNYIFQNIDLCPLSLWILFTECHGVSSCNPLSNERCGKKYLGSSHLAQVGVAAAVTACKYWRYFSRSMDATVGSGTGAAKALLPGPGWPLATASSEAPRREDCNCREIWSGRVGGARRDIAADSGRLICLCCNADSAEDARPAAPGAVSWSRGPCALCSGFTSGPLLKETGGDWLGDTDDAGDLVGEVGAEEVDDLPMMLSMEKADLVGLVSCSLLEWLWAAAAIGTMGWFGFWRGCKGCGPCRCGIGTEKGGTLPCWSLARVLKWLLRAAAAPTETLGWSPGPTAARPRLSWFSGLLANSAGGSKGTGGGNPPMNAEYGNPAVGWPWGRRDGWGGPPGCPYGPSMKRCIIMSCCWERLYLFRRRKKLPLSNMSSEAGSRVQ